MSDLIQIPSAILEQWTNELKHWTRKGGISPRNVFPTILRENRAGIKNLWSSFNEDRKQVSRIPYTSAQIVAPYLLAFHLPNVARALGVLRRVDQSFWKSLQKPLRVVDVGCGTGALVTALLQTLKESHIHPKEIHLVDQGNYLLACAQRLAGEEIARTHRQDIGAFSFVQTELKKIKASPDLIHFYCMGYVLNEGSQQRNPLMKFFHENSMVKSPVAMLVIEPAESRSAQRLQEFRDHLSEMEYGIFYPCPASTLCPLTANPKDRCYSEFDWKIPNAYEEVLKLLPGSRKRLGSSAYLVTNAHLTKQIAVPQKAPLYVGFPFELQTRKALICDGKKITRATIGKSAKDVPCRCSVKVN